MKNLTWLQSRFQTVLYSLLLSVSFSVQAQSVPENIISSTPNARAFNCDMVQCPNFGGNTLKAIVWEALAGGSNTSRLFIEFNGTAITSPPLAFSGFEPDVVIGDDLNNLGTKYIVAVIYTMATGPMLDVYIQTYSVDLVAMTVSGIGAPTKMNANYAKYPRIDLFADNNVTIGGVPSLHEYVAVWEESGLGSQDVYYFNGDINTITSSPPPIGTMVAAGQNPDVAAVVDMTSMPTPGDHIAYITFYDKVYEINLTTPGISNVTLSNINGFNRIEGMGIYTGGVKWQVVGSEWQSPSTVYGVYAENNVATGGYLCSGSLSTTIDQIRPVVAAGIGATGNPMYFGNSQYTIGWLYDASTPLAYSQNIDPTTGLQMSSSTYYQMNLGSISSAASISPLAISSSSNTGFGVLSTWFNGTNVVYKMTSTGATFGYRTTSLNTISLSNEVTIYPNPAQDKLHLQGVAESDYIITDITGKQLQKGHITAHSPADVSSLSPGMYLIQLTTISKTLKFSK